MRRRPNHRTERLAAQIREALSRAIRSELKDPRVGIVTVTAVHLSADLSHAKIHVSVMGSDQERDGAIGGLEHARGFLRSYVARHVRLRTTPELHFLLDRGLEHAKRIEAILSDLHDDED